MPIDFEDFRVVLRRRTGSVSIVTMQAGDQTHGLTVMDFCAVSMQPPLMLVSIGNDLRSHTLLDRSRAFAISLLRDDQQGLSDRFAGRDSSVLDRLAGVATHTAVTGAPILADCLGWLDCTIAQIVPAGDHTVYIGQVEAGAVSGGGKPLMYWDGDYRRLAN
jgi:flavin reductase (DIM6/NTAB) family NADH-FMN oxidoreductase RutF